MSAFIHANKLVELSAAQTNQITDGEVSHAPNLVEDKQHGEILFLILVSFLMSMAQHETTHP